MPVSRETPAPGRPSQASLRGGGVPEVGSRSTVLDAQGQLKSTARGQVISHKAIGLRSNHVTDSRRPSRHSLASNQFGQCSRPAPSRKAPAGLAASLVTPIGRNGRAETWIRATIRRGGLRSRAIRRLQ